MATQEHKLAQATQGHKVMNPQMPKRLQDGGSTYGNMIMYSKSSSAAAVANSNSATRPRGTPKAATQRCETHSKQAVGTSTTRCATGAKTRSGRGVSQLETVGEFPAT